MLSAQHQGRPTLISKRASSWLLEDAISFIGAFYGVIAELLPAVAQLYLNYISCRISGHNDQSMDVYICSESCVLVISIGDCFQNHR
jgi:hypothetical protein